MKFLLVLIVVVGLAMVAVPLWIAFWSAFGFAMPWLCFAFFAWLFFAAGRRPRGKRWSRDAWPSASPRARSAPPRPRGFPNPGPVPAAPPRPAPAPSAPIRPTSALPAEAQEKVDRIRAKVEVLQGYAGRFPAYSRDLYLIRQTASEYLPRTIQAYLAVPPARREQVMVSTGKTPLQELHEQLDLLDHKLNEIAETVELRDLDRLLANRRFLEERFGPVVRA